jgi:16S rRNA (guanine527-N7)-methyltransferase
VSEHERPLREAGTPLAAIPSLCAYLDLLAAWSRRVNLTGARDARARVAILVAPAQRLLPLLLPGALIDIGSGNGSPGLVLGLLEPDRELTLLEPRAKRWAFLREAARACGRPDARVVRARHDQYEGPPAKNVTLRALRLPSDEIARLVAPGGQALLGYAVAAQTGVVTPVDAAGETQYRFRPWDVPRET